MPSIVQDKTNQIAEFQNLIRKSRYDRTRRSQYWNEPSSRPNRRSAAQLHALGNTLGTSDSQLTRIVGHIRDSGNDTRAK